MEPDEAKRASEPDLFLVVIFLLFVLSFSCSVRFAPQASLSHALCVLSLCHKQGHIVITIQDGAMLVFYEVFIQILGSRCYIILLNNIHQSRVTSCTQCTGTAQGGEHVTQFLGSTPSRTHSLKLTMHSERNQTGDD